MAEKEIEMNAHNKVRYLVPLLFFAVMLMLVHSVIAADLYVTPTRPASFGSGTLESPFRNISTALRVAQPGDTIKLMAGVHGMDYKEASCTSYCSGVITPTHGGTPGHPITITSYPNPLDAIIDGHSEVASCVFIGFPNIVIDGLELRNCGQLGIQADGDTYGTYDASQAYGNYGEYGTRHYNANGIDNLIIKNNYIHDCKMDAVKTGHGNNITVENNNMYNVSTTSGGHSTMQMNGIYGGIVRNNWMHDDLNPLTSNAHVGFFMKGGSKDVIFENNKIENMVSPYAGIEIGDNMEWYNIRYTPSEISGLNDRILRETLADNEIMPNSDGSGMYTSSTTYQPEVLAEARNIIVRGNIVVNCDPPLSSRNSYNVTWYNNTVINGGQSAGWYKLWTDGYNGIAGRGYDSHAHVSKNQKFYNNLFYNNSVAVQNLGVTGRAYYVKDKDGDNYPLLNQEGLEMDYNQYYNMGYTWFSPNISKVAVDTHALYNINPDLDINYRPAPGNAALTSGADLRSLGILGNDETWVDRDGVTRPTANEIANGYVIGAVGYDTSTTVPTVNVTSPANNAVISGTVSILATASDNVGVTKVEFYVSGVLVNTETTAPYSYNWDTTSYANGSYTIRAKSYDANGNVGLSENVAVTVNNPIIPDAISPTVNLLTPLNNATVSGTVYVSANATDNVGVKKFEIFVDSDLVAVMNTTPYSFNLNTSTIANGLHAFTARAYDAAGNVGQSTAVTVMINNPLPDLTAPVVTSFAIPATATALNVPVTSFSASDNVGVTGYLISESSVAPAASASGWATSAPTWFNFSASGSKTAYAWTKDAAGNVSASLSSSVVITIPDFSGLSLNTDTTPPVVNTFIMPVTATTTTVAISSLAATDNIGVTGYLVTESATVPSASASGWTTSAPTSFTFSGAGSKTAYAWAKDAAGKISASLNRSVVITLPDTTAPVVTTFTAPLTATTLSIAISLTATDNIGVTGYMINESASVPSASTVGWSVSAPSSYTFATTGTKTLYAWVKDAAGNVSTAKTAIIVISIPKTVSQDVMVLDSSTTFPTIQDAYNTVPESGTIAAKDVTLSEQLNFNRAVNVNLAGGMDASFQSTTGTTAVSGVIKISKGKVVVSKITVR